MGTPFGNGVNEELTGVGTGDLDPDVFLRSGGGSRRIRITCEEQRIDGIKDWGGIYLELGLIDVGHGKKGSEEEVPGALCVWWWWLLVLL